MRIVIRGNDGGLDFNSFIRRTFLLIDLLFSYWSISNALLRCCQVALLNRSTPELQKQQNASPKYPTPMNFEVEIDRAYRRREGFLAVAALALARAWFRSLQGSFSLQGVQCLLLQVRQKQLLRSFPKLCSLLLSLPATVRLSAACETTHFEKQQCFLLSAVCHASNLQFHRTAAYEKWTVGVIIPAESPFAEAMRQIRCSHTSFK